MAGSKNAFFSISARTLTGVAPYRIDLQLFIIFLNNQKNKPLLNFLKGGLLTLNNLFTFTQL
jgi:hypothetical protein